MEIMHTSAKRHAALVWSPHPLLAGEGRIVEFSPPTGAESLHAYLVRCGVDLSGPVIVTVDRTVIPRDWLCRVKPKPGTLITVRAAVAGGDGSQVVAVVAMIALMMVAPYAGAALASAAMGGGAAGAVAASTYLAGTTITGMMIGQAVVTVAGAMAISALTPRPKVDLGKAYSGAKASSTYSLSGGSNQARPYEPLGLTLGRHRVFFDLASRPYSTLEGDDQYLSQVFHVSLHGPYGAVRVEDLRLGDTPLSDYQDVVTQYAVGSMPLLVAYNVDTVAGAAVTVAGGAVIRTSSADTTRIEVDLQVSLFYAGNGGIEERAVTLRAEYRPVSGGAWLPFVTEIQRGYYTHYWSHGVWSDYIGAESGGVSSYWVQDSFDVNHSPSAHVDGVGGWRWVPFAGRNVMADAPPDVQAVLAAEFTLYSSSSTPLRKSYGIDVAAGQYEVRVSRVTADETDSRATSEVAVTSVKSYQSQAGDFSGQCFLAVKVRASGQLNGTLATLSGIVSQPVGVNTYSSNPADLFLLYARGHRHAGRLLWGAGLYDAELDLPAIAAWRTWCIANNLSCNVHIDSSKSVWDILQAITRCGRGSPSWSTGKLGVLWDAADQPVIALFGPSNIKRGTFEVAYGSEFASDEITLNYVDAADNYSAAQVRIVAPGVTTPLKPAAIELWGCTDADMAARECRLQVAHQIYRTRQVSWVTDMEGLVVTRGDVVALSHDLTQWGASGRLLGGTTTALQLDRAITLDPVANWVTVVTPEGVMHTVRVQYAAGEHDTLTLLDALPSAPDDDNPIDWRYLADYQATPGKRVKITDIKPASMHEVRITAMDDPDEYYAAESGTYDPPPVRKWTADEPTISALQFSEELIRAGSGYAVALTVGWSETGAIATRRVRYSLDGGPWVDAGIAESASIRLTVPDTGTITVVVTGYTGIGQTRTEASVTGIHTLVGQDVPPPAVAGFAVATLADGTRSITWTVGTVPPDVTYTEIRYAASSGTAWGSMTPLGRVPYGSGRGESNAPAAGTWTFEARLLDIAGNYSATGARVTVTLGAAPSAVGAGVNRLYNTSRLLTTGNDDGWFVWTNRAGGIGDTPGGDSAGYGFNAASWALEGRCSRFTRLGTSVEGEICDWSSVYQQMDVRPGMRLEAHALLGAHRCTGSVMVLFYNAAGEYHSQYVVGSLTAAEEKNGGKLLSDWKKTGGFITTPATAAGATPSLPARAILIIRQGQTDPTYANSYLFHDQAFLGEAGEAQQVLSPWSDGARAVTNTAQLTDGAGFGAAAAAAQDAADAANAKHAEMAADNKLSPLEKQAAQKEWAEVVASYGGIDGQAAGWSITTERTAHTAGYSALSGYLSPLLASLTTTSDIDGPTYRTNWSSYYAARQTVLNKIAAIAATTSAWVGVSGSGKPLDNAGRVIDLGTGTGAGQRQSNDAPGWYPMGTTQQFKWSASVGLGFSEWGVLRTEQQFGEDAGGPATQTWKSAAGEWKRTGTRAGGWAAWNRRIDRQIDPSNVTSFVSDGAMDTNQLANNAATDVYNLSRGAVGLVPAGVEIHTLTLTTTAPTDVILTVNTIVDICNYTAGVALAVRYQAITPAGGVVSLGAMQPELPLQAGFSSSIYDSLGVVNAYCSGSLDAGAWIYGQGISAKKVITLPAFASVRVYVMAYGDTTSSQISNHQTQVQSSNLTVEVIKK